LIGGLLLEASETLGLVVLAPGWPKESRRMDCFAPWRPQRDASGGSDVADSDGSGAADDVAVCLGRNFNRALVSATGRSAGSSQAPNSLAAGVAVMEGDESENESEPESEDAGGPARPGGRRTLWNDKVVNPSGPKNWQWTPNLEAAFKFQCGCEQACMAKAAQQLGPAAHVALYDHRRAVRAAMLVASVCMRDHLRGELERHLDLPTGCFSRSFVIMGLGGCCATAFGLSVGVSESTFARARADARKNKPLQAGRQVSSLPCSPLPAP